jgi:hypothetical protein
MSYASSLGLTGRIAACVRTTETGVGAVMRRIVAAAAAAAAAASAAQPDEQEGGLLQSPGAAPANDGASGTSSRDNSAAANDDHHGVLQVEAEAALYGRAGGAKRVMAEGRGLVIVERSELLLLLQEAGCSAEQQCEILPAEPEPERGSSSEQ